MIESGNIPARFFRRTLTCLAFTVAATLASGTNASAEEIANSVDMKLRLCDAGRFEMGENNLSPGFYKDHSEFVNDDVQPFHPVVLTKPFYLATTEVTLKQFRQFVQETDYKTSAEKNERGGVGWDPEPPADNPRYVSTFRDDGGFNWRKPGFEQADDHPVTGISYADAKAFCAWLSQKEGVAYRLPTEAEWEYAARAGTETYFSFGNVYRGTIHRFANIGNVELERAFPDRVRRQWLVDLERDPADRHVFTAPVGSYEANPWGLFDMYGNVWEWCEDRFLDTAYSPYTRAGHHQVRKRAIDPVIETGDDEAGEWRVIRGGSWFNAPIQCRSSVRGYFEASDAGCYLGFRVARDAPDELIVAARQKFEQSERARATLLRLADRIQERRDGRLTVELSQQQTRLNDEVFEALQSLDEPVDLHVDCRGELTAAQLSGLAETPHLRGLVLSNMGPNITDSDLAVLEDHPQLELLHLANAPKLSDALFAHLKNLKQLELLHLESAEISDRGLGMLPELKHLTTLRLAGTASQGLVLERFRQSPLKQFSCNQLNDEGARLLAQFPSLDDVSISGSSLSGEGLAEIARLPRLQRLDLSGCKNLRDEEMAVLGDVYRLDWLQLNQTAVGDRTAAGLSRLNHLRDLRIGSDQLSDDGVRRLCEIVSLHNFSITPEAVNVTDGAFIDLWRLINLRSLVVSAPRISGSGFSALSELPTLDWMSLDGAGIADIALQHAAASNSLQDLSIGGWQRGGPAAVTDAGMSHMVTAKNLKRFSLFRKGTQVTDRGLEELRSRRSELSVNVHLP